MAGIWLDIFLGKIGKYIVLFIDRYWLFILPVVIIYGIFLTIASINLKRIEAKVLKEILRQGSVLLGRGYQLNYVQIVDSIKIDWDKFIKTYSFFPYIASHQNLWVSKTNIFTVRDIILSEKTKIIEILSSHGLMKKYSEEA
jgi:hypothetical protein